MSRQGTPPSLTLPNLQEAASPSTGGSFLSIWGLHMVWMDSDQNTANSTTSEDALAHNA